MLGSVASSRRVKRSRAAGLMRWSDPATWGGSVPGAGQAVTIPVGVTILLDTSTASIGHLEVAGALQFDAGVATALTAASINVTGSVVAGAPGTPHGNTITITLTGARGTHTARASNVGGGFTNDGVARGIQVQPGARWELFGQVKTPWLRLGASASNGATALTLDSAPSGWASGDQIIVGPTAYYGESGGTTDIHTLSGTPSGATANLTAGISGARYGVLQYATNAGISLTPGTLTKPLTDNPDTFDHRAPIGNLTRSIVIQGANDSDWSTNGFGVHLMVMGLSSVFRMDSVEVRRCGQRGALGRYPIHWHMCSYNMPNGMDQPSDGTFLGAKTTDYVTNCAIHQSEHRMLVIHGTHGVVANNNVGYDIKGMAIFYEEGASENNTTNGNLVAKIRQPVTAVQNFDNHSLAADPRLGVAGLWVTNPANTVENNEVCDSEGCGGWWSIGSTGPHVFGLSANISVSFANKLITSHKGNRFHSNRRVGLITGDQVSNAAGDIVDAGYSPGSGLSEFTIEGVHVWKNGEGGYKNRVGTPNYLKWVISDNLGCGMNGATVGGFVNQALATIKSLNVTTIPSWQRTTVQGIMATYHNTFRQRNCIFIDVRDVLGARRSQDFTNANDLLGVNSVFQSWDLYLNPIEVGFAASTGNRFINVDYPIYRTPSQYQDIKSPYSETRGSIIGARGISGVAIDQPGMFGGNPGDYLVFDTPFYTHNTTTVAAPNSGSNAGRLTARRYVGLQFLGVRDGETSDGNLLPTGGFTIRRLSDTAGSTTEVGECDLPDSNNTQLAFRHTALAVGGRYTISMVGRSPESVRLGVSFKGAHYTTDTVLVRFPWSGSVPCRVGANRNRFWWVNSGYYANSEGLSLGYAEAYTAASSLSNLESGAAGRFWQDTTNNVVWVKFRGGLGTFNPDDTSLNNWLWSIDLGISPA